MKLDVALATLAKEKERSKRLEVNMKLLAKTVETLQAKDSDTESEAETCHVR